MKLTSDRLAVIVEITEPEQSNSGIIIAGDTEPKKKNVGTIAHVGPGRLDANGNTIPMEVAVGDRIIFTPFAGTTLNVDGQEYLVLREVDCIAVIE